MNVYERILNILLEARVDMFIQDRLDEAKLKGKQGKLDVNKNKKLDSEDFKMLRSGKRADEGMVKARNKAMKNAFVSKIRHQEAPGAGLSSREREAAGGHEVRLAGAKKKPRVPTNKSEKLAVGRDNLRQGDTYNESKNSLKTREFMKSWEGQAAKTASSGSDPAIKNKKLNRAGEMRKAGNVSGARAEIAKSQKLDKPQLP
jgi:hypothetical protein